MTRFAVRRLLDSICVSRRSVVSLAVATLCMVALAEARAQLTYSTFVSGPSLLGVLGQNNTIGFAYAGNKFVGSVYFGPNNSQLYATDLDGSNVRKFATPIPGGSGEMYVSSSLGLGGFVPRNIFAGFENNGQVYQVANDGSTVSLFASGLVGGVRSIAFDPYGLYGNDMIVATHAGNLYRINMSGGISFLANVGEDAEGISFAPQAFGPFAKGTLIVASEGSGSLRAVGANGSLTTFAHVASAEMVSFVPLNLGLSGNPLEGFYAASYANDIVKVGYTDFLPYLGDMMVTGEGTHLMNRVHWDGANFVTNVLSPSFPGQPEDGIFVTADIINSNVPEPATAVLLAPGLLAVGASVRRRRVRTQS